MQAAPLSEKMWMEIKKQIEDRQLLLSKEEKKKN
jgi:hypothetical protein